MKSPKRFICNHFLAEHLPPLNPFPFHRAQRPPRIFLRSANLRPFDLRAVVVEGEGVNLQDAEVTALVFPALPRVVEAVARVGKVVGEIATSLKLLERRTRSVT